VQAAEMSRGDKNRQNPLLGDEEKIREAARTTNANLNGWQILDHRKSADFGKIATLYHELRRAKRVTLEEAEQTVKDHFFTESFSQARQSRRFGRRRDEHDRAYGSRRDALRRACERVFKTVYFIFF
jgi:hypothetical protein